MTRPTREELIRHQITIDINALAERIGTLATWQFLYAEADRVATMDLPREVEEK